MKHIASEHVILDVRVDGIVRTIHRKYLNVATVKAEKHHNMHVFVVCLSVRAVRAPTDTRPRLLCEPRGTATVVAVPMQRA